MDALPSWLLLWQSSCHARRAGRIMACDAPYECSIAPGKPISSAGSCVWAYWITCLRQRRLNLLYVAGALRLVNLKQTQQRSQGFGRLGWGWQQSLVVCYMSIINRVRCSSPQDSTKKRVGCLVSCRARVQNPRQLHQAGSCCCSTEKQRGGRGSSCCLGNLRGRACLSVHPWESCSSEYASLV